MTTGFELELWAKAHGYDLGQHFETLRSRDLRSIRKQLEADHQRRMRKLDAEILRRAADLLSDEDEEPDRNGKDDSGQESGLAGGGKDGDGPSLD